MTDAAKGVFVMIPGRRRDVDERRRVQVSRRILSHRSDLVPAPGGGACRPSCLRRTSGFVAGSADQQPRRTGLARHPACGCRGPDRLVAQRLAHCNRDSHRLLVAHRRSDLFHAPAGGARLLDPLDRGSGRLCRRACDHPPRRRRFPLGAADPGRRGGRQRAARRDDPPSVANGHVDFPSCSGRPS